MRTTWTLLDDGSWGVRVDADNGETIDALTGRSVPVTRRDESVESIMLGKCEFTGISDYSGQRFAKYRKGTGRAGGLGSVGPSANPFAAEHQAQQQGPSQTTEALRFLAGRCDGAQTFDGQGFNKFDANSPFIQKMVELDRLTPKQEHAVLKTLRKYRGQLARGGFDFDEIAQDFGRRQSQGQRQAPSAPPRQVELSDVTLRNGNIETRLVLAFPYDARLVARVKEEIPDRGYDDDRRVWHAPVERCLEVERFAQAHGFQITSDAAAAIQEHREIAEHERAEEAERIAASKAADSDIELPVEGLFPFQRAGVAYVLGRRRCFIADEMGLGKTLQALTALEADNAYPALVVCPKSVKSVWRREAERWLPHRTVQTMDTAQMLYAADITIINYDIVFKRLDALWNQFCSLVLDESHNVKNRKAQRTQAIKDIAGSLGDEDPMILCLSGTPLVNRPAELITQLDIMRRLDDLGGWKRYWGRFCGNDQNGAFHLNELNTELRSTCMVRRLKKDVLTELPPRTFADVPTDLDSATWAEYHRAQKQFLMWYAEQGGDVSRAMRAEQLVKMNSLRRLAGRGKIAGAIEWIREFLDSDGKLVIFAEHKDVQEAILEAVADYNPRRLFSEDSDFAREQARVDFQEDDSVRVIVLGLRVGGEGITLTAASNVCFIELGWTPKSMLQAVDRCHRIGQRDAVTGWQLVCPRTIDDYMAAILAEKRAIMDQVLDGRAAAEIGDQSIMNEVADKMLADASRKEQ